MITAISEIKPVSIQAVLLVATISISVVVLLDENWFPFHRLDRLTIQRLCQ